MEAGYVPPEVTESFPAVGPGVVASAVVDNRGTAAVFPPPKTINFSGYEWAISSGPNYRAGSRNFVDPANVWTDANGALHLRISGTPGRWSAAEVKLTRSLGYGTYRFQVRDIAHLEPSAALTLVSWGPGRSLHPLVPVGVWAGDVFKRCRVRQCWNSIAQAACVHFGSSCPGQRVGARIAICI